MNLANKYTLMPAGGLRRALEDKLFGTPDRPRGRAIRRKMASQSNEITKLREHLQNYTVMDVLGFKKR